MCNHLQDGVQPVAWLNLRLYHWTHSDTFLVHPGASVWKLLRCHDSATVWHCRNRQFGASILNYFCHFGASAWNCFHHLMHIKLFVNPTALYQCPQTCKWLYVDLTFSFLTCTVLSAFQVKVRSSNLTLRGIVKSSLKKWKKKKKA